MKRASELPEIAGAPHFWVRGNHTWGRAATLAQAIKDAGVYVGEDVHVCRTDENARCDPVDGSLVWFARGAIWKGKVINRRTDIRLTEMTHPERKADEVR